MVESEDSRVKAPLLVHFSRLGYGFLAASQHSVLEPVTLIHRPMLEEALIRLHNSTPVDTVMRELRQAGSNRKDRGKGFWERITDASSPVIDYENLSNNTYYVATELSYPKPGKGSFRPDITVFVNGIPLGFIEVKKPNNERGIQAEFDRMHARLKNDDYTPFFNQMQILGFTNNQPYGTEQPPMFGSFYTTPNGKSTSFNYWREEQHIPVGQIVPKIERSVLNETLKGVKPPDYGMNVDSLSPANQFATSLFAPERFLFLIQHGMVFLESQKYGVERHIMRYPQYFATNAIRNQIAAGETKGVIWHTQGSGKTALAYHTTQILQEWFLRYGKAVKFFFIPDRTDLTAQAASEFTSRGMAVNTVGTRKQFVETLRDSSTTLSTVNSAKGTISVLNIHKFSSDAYLRPEDADRNVQRVYFVDEAHRSYTEGGRNLTQLHGADPDGIYISLTGTPLIGDDKRTTDLHGDYWHKYSQGKSVADGYTLKIKRDAIQTEFSDALKEAFNIEDDITPGKWRQIGENEAFNQKIGDYIQTDLQNFRKIKQMPELGAMIVCSSTEQAKQLHQHFQTTGLRTGLVISAEGDTKPVQDAFKGTKTDGVTESDVDALIVYDMLSTGFDSPRLKRLYLLRTRKDHNLLQTLARVNRPYRGIAYGHIVDFVDITEAYQSTNESYLAELGLTEEQFGDYFIDAETIKQQTQDALTNLTGQGFDLESLETWTQQIEACNTSTLTQLVAVLQTFSDNCNELILTHEHAYVNALPVKAMKQRLNETSRRLQLLKGKTAANEDDQLPEGVTLDDIVISYLGTTELGHHDQTDINHTISQLNTLKQHPLLDTPVRYAREHNEPTKTYIERLQQHVIELSQQVATNKRIAETYTAHADKQRVYLDLHNAHKQILKADDTTVRRIVCQIDDKVNEVVGGWEEHETFTVRRRISRPIKTILTDENLGEHWKIVAETWETAINTLP